jgi:hypothetical protein
MYSWRSTMRLILAALLLLVAPRALLAQTVLYVASGGGNLSSLYTVDPLTAQATLVGPVLLNGTTQLTITALAFQPGTGVLFGVSGSEYSPSRQLLTINPTTAHASSLGTIGTTSSQNVSDITFAADGTLYGWTTRGGPLVSLDPVNAARTLIGSTANGTQGNGLAFNPSGTLYVAGPTGPGDLYTVNRTTGAITSVATLSNVPLNFGSNINAMASDAQGLLYVTGRDSGHQLATINPATGVMTSVGTLPFEADALAFSPIPEPSVIGLLAAGLLGLLGRAMVRARR